MMRRAPGWDPRAPLSPNPPPALLQNPQSPPPPAYHVMLREALKGDHALFVSGAELEASWCVRTALWRAPLSSHPSASLPTDTPGRPAPSDDREFWTPHLKDAVSLDGSRRGDGPDGVRRLVYDAGSDPAQLLTPANDEL